MTDPRPTLSTIPLANGTELQVIEERLIHDDQGRPFYKALIVRKPVRVEPT